MSVKLLELQISKDLLDPNFEGYKLSLDVIPSVNYALPTAVRTLQHPGDTFSYLYLTLFSMENHLIYDPWVGNSVYYISENLKIIKLVSNIENNSIQNTEEVLQIPDSKNTQACRYNAAIVFADSKTAIVTDGFGFLHICDTGNRFESRSWTVEFSIDVLGENYQFTILDARCVQFDESVHLHCLLTAIVEDENGKISKNSKASTEIFWVTLKKANNVNWLIADILKMNTAGIVKYGYFAPKGECLFIESTKSVQLPQKNLSDPTAISKKDSQYYWQQSMDDIKIWFGLPKSCVKEDVNVNITEKHVNIALKGDTFLSGDMFQRVDSDLTTWNVNNNRLEITLCKHNEGQMWSYLVKGDDRGEEIIDPALVSEIHERLSHLCSENETMPDDTMPAFNPGQLEACDTVSDEEESRLFAIDSSTKTIVKEVNLSCRQKLFNVRLSASEVPCLCVRHDVDGTLWKLDYGEEDLCKHFGTLNAFGYVLASKQWKYCMCSPDLSYAVIAAAKQNLFIYKQNCSVDTDLRNRKTGHKFSEIGKQYLITLNTSDEILGVHATNDFLFVLTKSFLHVYFLKSVK